MLNQQNKYFSWGLRIFSLAHACGKMKTSFSKIYMVRSFEPEFILSPPPPPLLLGVKCHYTPQLTIGCFALARFHETKIQITLYLQFEICVIVHFES